MKILDSVTPNRIGLYPFCFLASLATFTSAIMVGLSYRLLSGDRSIGRNSYNVSTTRDAFETFAGAVIIAPLIETLVFQMGILYVCRKIKLSDGLSILLATAIFSSAHLRNHLLNAINTLLLGFVLSFSYVYWLKWKQSHRAAFESSMLIHALHNLTFFALLFVPSPI